jgi:hypothetical protein
MRYSTPSGNERFSRSITSRTCDEASIAFEPGRCDTPIATAGRLSSRLRSEYRFEPSSTRPMSRSRVICPSGVARMTMPANSSSVVRRPWALTESWKVVSAGLGGAPSTPAATWTFCSRIARTTSVAVSCRAESLSGSSHTRMLYSPAPNTCTAPTPAILASSSFTCRCAKFDR